jgi:hypothetical protein
VADPAEDPPEVLCLTCLRRPSRPGSVYCSGLCRVLHALRLVRLALVLAALGGLLVACGTSTASSRPAPAPSPARLLTCAWYTPTYGSQQVILTATGPACSSPALIEQVAKWSGHTWLATRLVPKSAEDLFAQVARAGSVVRVWFTGNDPPTLTTAGLLADDLQAGGWTPQLPQA